jgi:hypothetical protein
MIPGFSKRHYEEYALKTAAKRTLTAWGIATRPLRRLPDFLVIGAQRAGTTSLYDYLIAHPVIARALPTKGVHYFDTEYSRSLGWYRAHFPTVLTAAYVRVRRNASMLTGEASPYYLFHPAVPARVASVLPDVKLVAMLRDPVDRAHSQYANERARGLEDATFEEALDLEERRLEGEEEKLASDPAYTSFANQHHSYLARGRYLEQLRRWHAFFPREQLLALESDTFFADPASGLARVHDFLGVERRPLASYPARNARARDPLRPETRERLEAYFREPNRRLFDYLGVDFGWNDRSTTSPAASAPAQGPDERSTGS